jgi:hypothetical protein
MEETEKSTNYTYDNNQKWDFGLLEGSDMSQAIEISMESFFRPRLNVAASEASKMNAVERVIMKVTIQLLLFPLKLTDESRSQSDAHDISSFPPLSTFLCLHRVLLACLPASSKETRGFRIISDMQAGQTSA